MSADEKWVTMADVAREANVSKITVSRVLRTPEKVARKTRDRVQAAIQALGYVPNMAAGNLASGKSRSVSALVSTLDGSAFAPTIDGLTRYLRQNGYELLLGNTDYSPEIEAELISVVLSRHPAGLVLSSSDHLPEIRAQLRRSKIATVEIWELPDDPIDMAVGYSNFDAGYAMTKFLCDTGRRHIAFVGGTSRTVRTQLRRDGYLNALKELGLTVPPPVPYDRSIASVVERGAVSMEWIFQHSPEVDAIFCVNDWIAFGAISEIRRRGKRVPEDVAVASHGDVDFGRNRGLGITTLKVPGIEIGQTAARLILERSAGADSGQKVVDLGFEIIRRATA